MRKLLLSALLLTIISISYAQNRGVIKGTAIDSLKNEPLELATVAILDVKDTTSALVSYMVTDKKGQFALHNLPSGIQLRVLIRFVGYKPFRKTVTLAKGETLDIGNISMSPTQLNEVTITGERMPIIVKKDTIEFNAEAFKTRPNAVVEELLKKLPGIEVDNNGNILMNGKKVTKVLVDGREFFPSDLRIATKNLDAELIDKVQVYDDRDDDPDHLIDEANVKKIINLKFKKKLKKSTFGRAYAGGGTQGRYESAGLFNMFRDTLQISFLGLSNNLSSTGFSFNDLYAAGGLNRGGDAITRGGGAAYGFGGNSGIQKTTSGGININTDYGKKLKVNLSYYFSHNDNLFNSINTRDQTIGTTDFFTSNTTNRQRIENKHNLSLSLKARPSDATSLDYSPFFSYNANNSTGNGDGISFSSVTPQINKSSNSNNNSGYNYQFQQSFNYNHQLKTKGSSVNINHDLSYNPDNSDNYSLSDLTSYVSTFPSYSLNRYGYSRNKNLSANLSISYRYPVTKKLTADVNVGGSYNNSVNNSLTYDYNTGTGQYDIFLLNQSSQLTRNTWKQHITPGITYSLTKTMNFVASLNTQWQQLNNQFGGRNLPDIDQNYFNLLPTARLSFGSSQKGNYSINYARSVSQPNIGDIIPYSIVFSPLYSVTGNPNLKQGFSDSYSLNYNAYKSQSQLSINLNGGFTYDHNGVFRVRTLDATTGVETSTPINMDGRTSTNINTYFNKRFKKTKDLQLSMSTSIGLNQGHNFFEINHQGGYQNTYGVTLNQRFSINWKDIITLDPSYNLRYSNTSYTGVNYNGINTTTHFFETPYNINWPSHTSIAGTYSFTYNPMVSPGFQKTSNLLNISIARQFLKKDRAEIKLSCYDILDQAISSYRYVYDNTISNTQSQIINRYFLLTLRWKFNSIKTEEKKPMGSMGMPIIMRP